MRTALVDAGFTSDAGWRAWRGKALHSGVLAPDPGAPARYRVPMPLLATYMANLDVAPVASPRGAPGD